MLKMALTCSLRLSLASQAFTGSLWLSMALCDSHSGSHWLSLPLSGRLWSSLAHYCSLISRTALDRLTGPLLGSHRRCHDDALSPALFLAKFECEIFLLMGKLRLMLIIFKDSETHHMTIVYIELKFCI